MRPYSKGQKNDFRDPEAIAETVQPPTMKFVATKTAWPRIFEKFAQADATDARQKGGTRFGLVAKAHGAGAETAQGRIKALYDLEAARYEGESAVMTASGDIRVWDVQSQPLPKLPDGRRVVLSSGVDITERKRMQKELQALATMEPSQICRIVVSSMRDWLMSLLKHSGSAFSMARS